MGMEWDSEIPGPEIWAETLRVLKAGAPLLAFGGARTFHRLASAIEDGGFILADTICWIYGQGFPKGKSQLKPSWEPITLAWKKGKRALAIDACRIDAPGVGRWPANVILDESAAAELDQQSGHLVSGNNPAKRSADKHRTVYKGWRGAQCLVHRGTDAGGASRFFYCAKASQRERGAGNTHPTVKPLKLCEYLARLILPVSPDAKLLIPYSGSGSEMIGARRAGWQHITGIEREREYAAIAQRRLAAA